MKRTYEGELGAIIRNPAEHFPNPRDVLEAPRLSDDQKLAVLRAWQHDATELATAEGEGMGGGEGNQSETVGLIKQAIAALRGRV